MYEKQFTEIIYNYYIYIYICIDVSLNCIIYHSTQTILINLIVHFKLTINPKKDQIEIVFGME